MSERVLISGQKQRREPPDPEWVRGTCPYCDEEVVSNAYYVPGRGYVIVWQCWSSLGDHPTCTFRRIL